MIIPRGPGLRGIFCFRGFSFYPWLIFSTATFLHLQRVIRPIGPVTFLTLLGVNLITVATLFCHPASRARTFKPGILYATANTELQKQRP